MNKTKIEWARNPDGTPGYTWNPITGCLNGCPYCYARKLANTRLKERYLANKNVAPLQEGWLHKGKDWEVDSRYDAPFYPRLWQDRMWLHQLVGSKRKPKGIFTCDMSDLFGIGVPEDWTRRILAVISKHPRHRFYLLTKQPQNLIKFSPFPDNCWVGVSATDTPLFVKSLNWLDEIEAKIVYISLEPLLGRIPINSKALQLAGISWVIIGAQTKPYKPPKIEWVQEIVEACDKAGIPVFLKENLLPLINEGWSKNKPECIPDLTNPKAIRQEMPK